MLSDSITEWLDSYFSGGVSNEVERRGRLMKERIGLSVCFHRRDIEWLTCRESEYVQYYDMIKDQVQRFRKYLNQDRFSRRLLIQFPADYYENKDEDYMPCPESFLVQYKDKDTYDIIFNERSVESSRAAEDIGLVLKLCKEVLELPGKLDKFYVHYMNIHKYMDGGSSEDFDVTVGYFDKK